MTVPVDLDAARATIRAWRALPGPEADALVAEVAALRGTVERQRAALTEIADSDPVDNALDPDWNRRIARDAIGGEA